MPFAGHSLHFTDVGWGRCPRRFRDASRFGGQECPHSALVTGENEILGQVKEASTQLEQACQLDPQSANALYALFEAQNRLGNRAAAQKTLGIFQELKRQEKAALDADNAAYDNDQTMRAMAAGFHLDAAVLLLQKQKLDLAEAHLRQAIRINPQTLPAREWLAKVYLQNRQLTQAQTVYQELVRLDPKRADRGGCRVGDPSGAGHLAASARPATRAG